MKRIDLWLPSRFNGIDIFEINRVFLRYIDVWLFSSYVDTFLWYTVTVVGTCSIVDSIESVILGTM